MKVIRAMRSLSFGWLLMVICLTGFGCGVTLDDVGDSLFNSAGDKIDYDSRVDAYREHGMNRRDARRNAYEDQIWDKMDQ
jgi:hypothetical protein